MNRYPEGQIVTVQGLFKDANGDLKDPTAIFLLVKTPDETETLYQYGVGSQITRVSTGTYQSDLHTTYKRGLWLNTWYSTGSYQADSGEQEFYVE